MNKPQSTVADQYTPYIKPVECGGKEDVRYLLVKDNRNRGLQISGAVPFHFDIHDYSSEAVDQANYSGELIRDHVNYLNVDAVHAGFCGDNGWIKLFTLNTAYLKVFIIIRFQ